MLTCKRLPMLPAATLRVFSNSVVSLGLPCFRIIVFKFLITWWSDLPKALSGGFFDPKEIHRFDCTDEHMGGAGNAGAWLDQKGTEFGDQWLGLVAEKGGKAPETMSMKPFLAVSPSPRLVNALTSWFGFTTSTEHLQMCDFFSVRATC